MIEHQNTLQNQTFHEFFDWWLGELKTNLEHLVSAANHHQNNFEDDSLLLPLIDKVVGHYEDYYKVKSNGAKGDVLSMFSPTWLTSLEDSLLWIAGWRPTTAIHLLYSKSGIQLEARLADLVPVLTDDLGDLSIHQINRIDELQRKTIHEERSISEKMALLQESAAYTPMVDLSNSMSENMRSENNNDDGERESYLKVESLLKSKKDELEEVLHMADGLRVKTLKGVVEILTPIQAVYFLIAAAELHLRIHDWGKRDDAT
ncbi:protein DOG1-like 4 [Rutidosis leptorrhynchoides]|uniref:protein DOG1-like 4 n=1 Tax=Rutidosis leptorrhynchoides TaxID=125765 RepID=UPI003A9A5441